MPHYYFDTHNGTHTVRDDVGLDMRDGEEARIEAVKALPCMARDVLPHSEQSDLSTEVRDEAGHVVFSAQLAFTSQRKS